MSTSNFNVLLMTLDISSSQALYLLEFLELNHLLGVSHFTFYNHTIGPKAQCILEHYIDGKIPQFSLASAPLSSNINEQNTTSESSPAVSTKITVDVLPWNLNMKSQKEIRTEGLFASLNDCLYRSMYR